MTVLTAPVEGLVLGAQTGDRDAFAELVRRFQDMAVGYAYAIIGDFHLAEDAAQEAFVGAWLDLPRLREPAAFAGWFRRMVFMRCSRQTRALKRGALDIDGTPVADPAPSAAARLEGDDRRRQVYRALAGLADEERLVTVLFYIGRHTHGEIADFLGMAPDTVNNRLRAARKKLEKGILDMAANEFNDNAPSRDDAFSRRVDKLTRPEAMDTERYVYGTVPVDGRDAWALFCACAAGDLGRARDLLDRDPDLVNAQYWYQFPIHMAVREGHADVVQLLLGEGADPGQSRYTYNSWDKLLATARERGHLAVQKLLETAMAERFAYAAGFAEVAEAIKGRDRARVEALLDGDPGLLGAADELGNNALHWAALTRQLDLIDYLVGAGADIEACRADGRTPVRVAIDGDYWFRHRDLPEDAIKDPWVVVRHLIGHGAAVDLGMACKMGDVEKIGAILADDPAAAGRLDAARTSPLTSAARSGEIEAVRLLIEHGADPCLCEDLATRGGALFAAAERNDLEMAEFLLERGADPNAAVDSSGSCFTIVEHVHPRACGPMQELLRRHGAVKPAWDMSAAELKEELRRRGADLDDDNGFLHDFLGHDDEELYDLFIEKYGERVPRIAPTDIWGGNLPPVHLLRKLLDKGLDPNRPNWIGRTFLHLAAEKGSVEVAGLLLEEGADLEAVELEHGGTPLAAAARKGEAGMVEFLLERGADPAKPEGAPWATARAVAASGDDAAVRKLLEG